MYTKLAVIGVVALILAACEPTPTEESSTSGWDIICVEGYKYVTKTILYKAYMAPKFGPDGRPVKCGGE